MGRTGGETIKRNLEELAVLFQSLKGEVDFFVTDRLLSGTPSIFNNRVTYVEWRHFAAKLLGVDPSEIYIVGSASIGYSLNPGKEYKKFDDDSDIDVAIVSHSHFEQAWSDLVDHVDRIYSESGKRVNPQAKKKINYIRRLTFDKCIALDRHLPNVSFGIKWGSARKKLIAEIGEPHLGKDLNFRLYRDVNSLRKYQIRSVRQAHDRIIEEGIKLK